MTSACIKRFICLVACLCDVSLHSQEKESRPAIQFRMISLDETLKELAYQSDNKTVIIDLPSFLFSEQQNYIGSSPLVFYAKPATAKAVPQAKIGSVLLPPEVKRVLLLVAAGPGGTREFTALPDDIDGFQAGKARLYNATPYALAIACDGVLVQLAPGKMIFASGNQNKIVLKLAYSYSKDGNWIRAGNNVFSLRPTIRQSIFFIASSSDYFNVGAGRKGGVHMVPLEEQIPADEAKAINEPNRAQKH